MPKKKKVKKRKTVTALLVISKRGKGRVLRGRVRVDIDGDRIPDRITFYRRKRGSGYVGNLSLSSTKKRKKRKRRK